MGFIAAVVLCNLLFFNGTFYYFDQFIANSFRYNLWIRLTFHSKTVSLSALVPSVFWHCWFGIRKSIQSAKIGMFICWVSGTNDLHVVQLIPVQRFPIISCSIKIETGLTLLVPACPDCPGNEAVNRVSVCRKLFYAKLSGWRTCCVYLLFKDTFWIQKLWVFICTVQSARKFLTVHRELRVVTAFVERWMFKNGLP